jgi:hypothetical protein
VRVLGKETDEIGITKTYYADGEGGLVIETSQDVTDILERNKARYNAIDEKARWGDGLEHIGYIPVAMIKELNQKGILRGYAVVDLKKFKAYLNDPVNRYLRTRPGRI